MTHLEAYDLVDHPSREWLLIQSRDDNPDVPQRDAARATLIRKAGGEPSYPSILIQAGNAIGAAAAFVADGLRTVDQAERERRLAICRECTHYDMIQGRCLKCGCFANLKARIASQHCPDSPPRW